MRLCGFILLITLCCVHSRLLNLSCKSIRAFVNGHNSRRSSLAKGQVSGQPGANNMKYMIWDQELANKAANWASVYRKNHNPDRTVASGRFQTGENLYWYGTTGSSSGFNVDQALREWFDEHRAYSFSSGSSSSQTGHYTQMAWADTTHVGCAVSRWKDGQWTRYFVVCNYGPPGNYVGQRPYQSSRNGSGKLYCPSGSNKCQRPYGNQCNKN